MAQGGGGGGGGGPDFHLPDEILAVIPTDPYDQLDVAKRITAMAISSRVSRLEEEAERLREKLADRDRVIEGLEDKLASLDGLFQESDARLRAAFDENAKLSKERDTLAITSKKLARDLAKLETFKKHLMQSLNDDNLPQQSEAVVTRNLSLKVEDSLSHSGFDITSEATETEGSKPNGLNHARHKFTITPYATPRLSPTGTPKGSSYGAFSSGASPKGFSTAGSSPRVSSGTASPVKSRFDGYGSMSSLYPSSQQSSTNSSPPHRQSFPGRNPRIDGKELFRQARTRLSYEQFAAFLANVKELNAQRQSREETLAKADEIFGIENKDLYLSFQGLLNRCMP